MASVANIRTQVAVRLATLTAATGLHPHAVWPDQINCPAAIVRVPAMAYHQTMGSDNRVTAEVLILAAPIGPGLARAEAKLDAYLDDTGASSIKAAIEGDKTLAGTADTVYVHGWRGRGSLEVNGVQYLGARVDLEIWAR